MKKLLYIINEGLRKFIYERTAGLVKAIEAAEEPVKLYILRSDGYSGFAPDHNRGEANLFRLPDYRDFDGILLDLNSNFNSGMDAVGALGVMHCIQQAEASGRPVISMANHVNGFHYVGIDNYAAMTSVIRHLHEVMGLTDFWFAMGPAANYENRIRTQALRDYCEAWGLPCGEERFYSESFITDSGVHAFHTLHERHGGRLPQAVICANDAIALGVSRAAGELGYEVPRDFMLTGFDNLDISAYLNPSITTVDQLCWTMGETCLKLMQRIWRGEEVPLVTHTPTRLVLRQSTGSAQAWREDNQQRIAQYIHRDMVETEFNYKLGALEYELPGCESVEDMCDALTRCISSLGCKGACLVLDRKLLTGADAEFELGERPTGVQYFAAGLKTEGYPEFMELVYAWEAGKAPTYPGRAVRGLLPELEEKGDRENFLILPLHFMEYTAGYLVIWDCVEMIRLKRVSAIVNTLTMAMHSFFARRRLAHINRVLSGMSVRDELTGLYNRFGYNSLASQLFDRTHADGKRLGILFIDMDGMKYFNDHFGHACGDKAILSVSQAIRHCVPANALAVRYGGDEFLVFMPAGDVGDIRQVLDGILEGIPRMARTLDMPDAPSISTGFVLTDPADARTLRDYVEDADRLMYANKKARKARIG